MDAGMGFCPEIYQNFWQTLHFAAADSFIRLNGLYVYSKIPFISENAIGEHVCRICPGDDLIGEGVLSFCFFQAFLDDLNRVFSGIKRTIGEG